MSAANQRAFIHCAGPPHFGTGSVYRRGEPRCSASWRPGAASRSPFCAWSSSLAAGSIRPRQYESARCSARHGASPPRCVSAAALSDVRSPFFRLACWRLAHSRAVAVHVRVCRRRMRRARCTPRACEKPAASDARSWCGAIQVRCVVDSVRADDEVSVAVMPVRRPSEPPRRSPVVRSCRARQPVLAVHSLLTPRASAGEVRPWAPVHPRSACALSSAGRTGAGPMVAAGGSCSRTCFSDPARAQLPVAT
jgi:hypothetical protein